MDWGSEVSVVTALALLGVGAALIFVLTTDTGGLGSFFGGPAGALGGPSAVPVNAAGQPFLDETRLNYYLSGFAPPVSGTQAAAIGAGAGGPLAGATFGISLGIGALVGWLVGRSKNDTLEDRQTFAKRLGFPKGVGVHDQVTVSVDDKSKGLYSYLTFAGYDPLRHTAMAVIGRKDGEGNAQWMLDVLIALWQVNFPFPR